MRLGLDPSTGISSTLSIATIRRIGGDTVVPTRSPNGTIRYNTSAFKPRLCVLSIREQGTKIPIQDDELGRAFLVFKMNYKQFIWEQGVRVGVQQAFDGYIINEGGAAHPVFTMQGNFGSVWVDKQSAIASAFGKGSLERPQERIDGQQSWFRLHALVLRYLSLNADRRSQGQALLELVWFDPQHGEDNTPGLRWVVTPMEVPSLTRQVDTQGVMNYKLVLAGIKDDNKVFVPGEGITLTPAPNPTYKAPPTPSRPVTTEAPPPNPPPPTTPLTKGPQKPKPYLQDAPSPVKQERYVFDFRFSMFAYRMMEFALTSLIAKKLQYPRSILYRRYGGPGLFSDDIYREGLKRLLKRIPDEKPRSFDMFRWGEDRNMWQGEVARRAAAKCLKTAPVLPGETPNIFATNNSSFALNQEEKYIYDRFIYWVFDNAKDGFDGGVEGSKSIISFAVNNIYAERTPWGDKQLPAPPAQGGDDSGSAR